MKKPLDATLHLKFGNEVTVVSEKASKKGDALLCHITEGHAVSGLKVLVFNAQPTDKLFKVRITRVQPSIAFAQKVEPRKRLWTESSGAGFG